MRNVLRVTQESPGQSHLRLSVSVSSDRGERFVACTSTDFFPFSSVLVDGSLSVVVAVDVAVAVAGLSLYWVLYSLSLIHVVERLLSGTHFD